jgi:hypothetical protein
LTSESKPSLALEGVPALPSNMKQNRVKHASLLRKNRKLQAKKVL